MEKEEKKIKENFCPACVSIPLAMVGAGVSKAGSNSEKNYRTFKNISFLISMIFIVLSIFIGIYYFFIKSCSKCLQS
jgi:hypothetical protein